MAGASAVAVRDGRIAAVGADRAISSHIGPKTRVIELGGATVTAGFVDAHLHLEGVGLASERLHLRGLDLEELLSAVAAAVARTPAGRVIEGRGWDQNRWTEASFARLGCEACRDSEGFPDKSLLERVAPDHPVVLTRVDGHAVWANQAALDLAGLDRSSQDPAGGRILRRADRDPTGILVDSAMDVLRARMPKRTPEDVERSLLAAQAELLSFGLTAAHDMGSSPDVEAAVERLEAAGQWKIRVFLYRWGQDDEIEAVVAGGPRTLGRRSKVVGVKLMADGALGSRGAWLLDRYADAPHPGIPVLDPVELERRVRAVERAGLGVAVHAIGDRANREVLGVLETIRAPRPRIEHAQVVDPADQPRFAALGAVASMQPVHASSDQPWVIDRLGPKRIEGAYAWRTLRAKGATLAFGSDAPVESADPRLGIWAAVTRTNPETEVSCPPREERIEPAVALRAFTYGAAYAVGEEQQLGTVQAGFLADLTVWSQDPRSADPRPALVRFTVVEGEVVFER